MAIISSREEDSQLIPSSLPFHNFSNTSSQSILLPAAQPTMSKEEIELMEYYATYNVWTGVRTAVVLTLFFIFTVTIILYKSKCKRHKKYELNPSLEDLPQRPLDYYDYWCPTPVGGGDNLSNTSKDLFYRVFDDGPDPLGSAPLPFRRNRDGSFSTVYSSFRIKSLPGSVLRMNLSRMGSLEKDDMARYPIPSYLRVPGVRLQSTGSSSDGYSIGSSLDLNYDATPMTLLGVPGMSGRSKHMMPTGGIDWDADQETAEWLQTIDINVIQPTPNVSPCNSVCGSVRSISEYTQEGTLKLKVPKRGRSYSRSSIESQDIDTASMTSDSVFLDDSFCEDQILPKRKLTRSPARCFTTAMSLDETSGKSSLVRESSLQLQPKHSSLKIKNKTVHSFRLPLTSSAASTPIPALLQGQPLQMPERSMRNRKDEANNKLGCNLGLPVGVGFSGSCERLSAHDSLVDGNVSQNTSTNSLQMDNRANSFEEPVISTYIVPGLRRVNSAKQRRRNSNIPIVKRADSEVASSSGADLLRRGSNSSSSSTEPSDSVSFHLMVPQLSFDCYSADNSRASSPSLSPTPPGSPMGSSLSVPSPFHRSISPSSRGRLRSQGKDGRGVLKRQYSQYTPAPPREQSPSPFGLPTSFEEEEELEDEILQENVNFSSRDEFKEYSRENEKPSGETSMSSNTKCSEGECSQSIDVNETKF